MKHITILLLLLAFGSVRLYAQKTGTMLSSQKPAVEQGGLYQISIAPAAFLHSAINLGIERRMTYHTSLLAQGQFGFRKVQLWESLGGNYIDYGGRLEYRSYPGKNSSERNGSLRGPYFATGIKVQRVQVNTTIQHKDYTMVKSQTLTPGFSVGWKFPLSRKLTNITLDVSVGVGYRFGKVTGQYAENSRSILFKDRGFVPAFGFRIGYSPAASKKLNDAQAASASKFSQDIQSALTYHDRYTRKKRKSIEKALAGNNLNPGKVNGKFDEQTIAAIRQFQRIYGLAVDGKAGESTLRKMKLGSD